MWRRDRPREAPKIARVQVSRLTSGAGALESAASGAVVLGAVGEAAGVALVAGAGGGVVGEVSDLTLLVTGAVVVVDVVGEPIDIAPLIVVTGGVGVVAEDVDVTQEATGCVGGAAEVVDVALVTGGVGVVAELLLFSRFLRRRYA